MGLMAPALYAQEPAPLATPAPPQVAVLRWDGEDAQRGLSSVIEADLRRGGRVQTLPAAAQFEDSKDPQRLDLQRWRDLGVQHLLLGSVFRGRQGGLVLRYFLIDTSSGARELAYDMPEVGPRQLRAVTHEVADMVFESLTGLLGESNSKLAYVSATGKGSDHRYELYICDADGFDPRLVARSRDPIFSISWSPDRNTLAYASQDRDERALYIQTISTGQIRKLVGKPWLPNALAWSPDGRTIAASCSYEGDPELCLIDVHTAAVRRLTESKGIDTEPRWSADSSRLVFTSDRDGSPAAYSLALSEHQAAEPAQRLTPAGVWATSPALTPDQKWLIYTGREAQRPRIATLHLADGVSSWLGTEASSSMPRVSQTGRRVAYVRNDQGQASIAFLELQTGQTEVTPLKADYIVDLAWSPLHIIDWSHAAPPVPPQDPSKAAVVDGPSVRAEHRGSAR
jgi:TolB protein